MDVEQRMNLSLDDIIKQKSKTSDKSAAKGKPPAISGAKAKTGPAKPRKTKSLKVGGKQKQPKAVGVQKKSLKVQIGGKQNKKTIAAKGEQQKKRVGPVRSGRTVQDGRRTVSLPQVKNLMVTITNEKALQSRQHKQVMPQMALGYQAQQVRAPRQQSAPQQMLYGYGPRNLLPREEYARVGVASTGFAAAQARPAIDFKISRMAIRGNGVASFGGAAPSIQTRRQLPYVDYDNSRTTLRMDYGR